MLIVIQQKGDKWNVIYSLDEMCINILHDTWDDVLIELNNQDIIKKAFINKKQLKNGK